MTAYDPLGYYGYVTDPRFVQPIPQGGYVQPPVYAGPGPLDATAQGVSPQRSGGSAVGPGSQRGHGAGVAGRGTTTGPTMPTGNTGDGTPQQSADQSVHTPLVDVLETPSEILVLADLPGFEKDEITIQADDSALVLSATREETDDDEERRIVSTERPRRFERVIPLPAAGNVDEASADHDNGVCTISIPKDGTSKRLIGFQ